MVPLSCRLSMVILLVFAPLAFGAPVLLNAVSAQTQIPSPGSESSAGAEDGYQRTLQAFQVRVSKGREIIELLHKINSDAKARFPENPSKQQPYFLMKLGEACPGSSYDGKKGNVVFQKNFMAAFNNTMNVESITELGEVSATYLLQKGEIEISFGTNSVTVVLDSAVPSRSRFTKVIIPAIRVEAESVLSIAGYRRITSDSVETSILNDAYQLLSLTNALRMDYFAADVMRSPKLQKKAIGIAGSGYFERHSEEYQKGVESVVPSSKGGGGESRLTLSKATKFMGSLAAVVLLGVGFFFGARRTIGVIQMFFMDDMARTYVKRYRSLSPMVMRSLGQLGRSLWGRNFLWFRRYHLIKRSDRWVLSDGKIDRYNLQSHPDNLIEVCLRDDNFKIRITRIKGTNVTIAVTSIGYSKQELMEHLRQISPAFTQEEIPSGEPFVAPVGPGSTLL